MSVSYERLWQRLAQLKLRKNDLRKILSPSTISKLNHNQTVSLDILCKICQRLHCDIGDVVQFRESSPLKALTQKTAAKKVTES